jgi:hypothetical protein
MRRMGTKTYGIIPSSILSYYRDFIADDGLILKAVLFKGKVQKIAFKIDSIQGKGTPEYNCTLTMENQQQRFTFKTKKLSYIEEIDIEVPDGAVIEIRKKLDPTCVIKNIHISILINLNKDYNEVKSFILEQDDEGI